VIGDGRQSQARPTLKGCLFVGINHEEGTAIHRNRSAIDVVLRYHYEQGLTERRLTIEDVFFPDLLDT
jgi:hypothetical protein